ncbi:hypothetical protein BASA81_001016 [Batrachochytrium salamandrivorans]|nr:hypothetical protein BASA81_001016 [Batrachochytrium salamandrivorans]
MFAAMAADPASFPTVQLAMRSHPACRDSTLQDRLEFQRLELLGDAVLDLVVTELLMNVLPGESEGGLTVRRSRLVDESSLAKWATTVGLSHKLVNPVSSVTSKMLADSVEAVLGAVYKDAGLEYVKILVETDLLKENLLTEVNKITPQLDALGEWNSKGDLQELLNKMKPRPLVDYVLLEESGPSHLKHFLVCVKIDGKEMGRGESNTKKTAEKLAAKQALEALSAPTMPVSPVVMERNQPEVEKVVRLVVKRQRRMV